VVLNKKRNDPGEELEKPMYEAASLYPRPSCSMAQEICLTVSGWLSDFLFPQRAGALNRYRDFDLTFSGGERIVMGVCNDYLGLTVETPMYFTAAFSLYRPGSLEPYAEVKSRKALIHACDSVLRITGTAGNGKTYSLYGMFQDVSLRNYDFSSPLFLEVREMGYLGWERVIARYESPTFRRFKIEKMKL
jgi:hypothetical protein